MEILSVRKQPGDSDRFIAYFQERWANDNTMMIYEDCITNCIHAAAPLPQWYLLQDKGTVIGGAGLVTNDFISRMDLYPWLCAVYIEEAHRGNAYGSLLMEKAKEDAAKAGFERLYLCTDHIGYYERYGFFYIGQGYHPWGGSSRIYCAELIG